MKMSKEKAKELIREERASAKMYRRYGLPTIAKDESRHRRILERRLK
jgi:hypothetical protein